MGARERIRYAFRVRGVHLVVLIVLALVALDAVFMAVFKPHRLSTAFPTLVILIQLFATSAGYKHVAESGYLDPLLLSSARRWSCGLLLFAVVFTPGFAVWMVVGASQWFALGWQSASCLHLAGLSALLFVSAIAWSVNLSLPRYSSALVWVLTMATAPMLTARPFSILVEALEESPKNLGHHLFVALALGATEPFSIASIPWPHGAEVVFLATGILALMGGLVYIDRKGVPLAS